jgi:uncharacterized membrane protein YphA (DoxX/SURF4 family)
MLKRLMNTSGDVTLTVFRVVLGIVFFAHGAQKMPGWFGGSGFHATMEFFGQTGMPAPVAFLGDALRSGLSRLHFVALRRYEVSTGLFLFHLLI